MQVDNIFSLDHPCLVNIRPLQTPHPQFVTLAFCYTFVVSKIFCPTWQNSSRASEDIHKLVDWIWCVKLASNVKPNCKNDLKHYSFVQWWDEMRLFACLYVQYKCTIRLFLPSAASPKSLFSFHSQHSQLSWRKENRQQRERQRRERVAGGEGYVIWLSFFSASLVVTFIWLF